MDFSVLVKRTTEASFAAFKELCESGPEQSDMERKIGLLKFINKTRQRLLRLLVLSKWCCQIPLVECCQQLVGTLSNHDTSFIQAADSLFFLHEGLQQARAPMYDIPSAVEVLLTGTYRRLPKCIEDLRMQPMLDGEEKKSNLQKLDTMLRSRLLDIPLPREVSAVKVGSGRVTLHVHGEFEVQLTLGYRGNPSLWRLLHLEILVGEASGKLKLTDLQKGTLRDDLECRMAALDNPFEILYSVLHEFCTAWVMDTVIRQVRALQQGRWRDAIRFDIIQDGSTGSSGQNASQGQGPGGDGDVDSGVGKSHLSPGLKVVYWLDLSKGADVTSLPSLRIEPGPDHHVACSHLPSVIDSATNSEAQFNIDLNMIDVERLVLRAILCSIHTRLLEVQRGLKSSNQLCREESDVVLRILKSDGTRDANGNEESMMVDAGEVGEEMLCVRAYAQSYITLGINIRNGRFVLRAHTTLLAPSMLTEMEETLNQGSITPVEVFVSLRTKSLLQLYGSIGMSLNMKVYEKGALAFKMSAEAPRLGTDVLIMSFPDSGHVYFLALQLDSRFMPLLTLLEGQSQSPVEQGSILARPVQVIRYMKMDVESFFVIEDEVNSSLLDASKMDLQQIEALLGMGLQVREPDAASIELRMKRLGPAFGSGVMNKFRSMVGEVGQNMDMDQNLDADKGGFSSGQLYKQSVTVDAEQAMGMGLGNQTSLNVSVLQSNVVGKPFPGNYGFSGWSGTRQSTGLPALGSPGATISPSRNSPYQKTTPGSRPLYQPETETLQSKSPLNPGDSATSPINLDDDDLSKLIDSISSKTTTIAAASGSNSLDDGASLTSPSRQTRMPTSSRASPLYRNALPNVRPPAPKISRHPVLSPGGSVRTASPARRSPIPDPSGTRTDGAGNLLDPLGTSEYLQASLPLSSPTRPAGHLSQRSLIHSGGSTERTKYESSKYKHKASDLLSALPALHELTTMRALKRRKIDSHGSAELVGPSLSATSTSSLGALQLFVGQPFSSILAAANQGKGSICSYTAFVLQVVRRCSLCIKHARLTSQMGAFGIPYVEEVGLRKPSTNLWFRLPASKAGKYLRSNSVSGWKHVCLCLGKPGSTAWEVKIQDDHFKGLHELHSQKNPSSGAQVITSEVDSHIRCTFEGLVLTYQSVEDDSIRKMLADLERLWNARVFALEMKRLLESKGDEKGDSGHEKLMKLQNKGISGDRTEGEKAWEVIKRAFRIEAVGLMSVWFNYVGSLPGVIARFVVEWETGKKGCTMHVSPDQLWPHTKYLEDYINGGEVELLLDCIRVTAGPLHSLAGAIRPARMPVASTPMAYAATTGPSGQPKAVLTNGQVLSPSNPTVTSPPSNHGRALAVGMSGSTSTGSLGSAMQGSQAGAIVSGQGRGTGLVPSSLLPTDVSVVLRSPYWIRIVYRRQFAVDMRCFAGDQVWLQPAPPPRGAGPGTKGSLPCPQFRPFVMEQITTGFNNVDSAPMVSAAAVSGTAQSGPVGSVGSSAPNLVQVSGGSATRVNISPIAVTRSALGSSQQASTLLRVGNLGNMLGTQGLVPISNLTPGRSMVPGVGGFHPSHRELNAAGYGFSDDGGYGGVWVPLAFLKKVLRGTLRYLGVVWLFAQFPGIIREVLASHLRESEGALLNHDPETPALRFFIQNCVFAVSVHRQQLVLQAINVKRYQNQQPQQQQQQYQSQSQQTQTQQAQAQLQLQPHQSQQPSQVGSDNDLSLAEMQEIGDFFARRAAFEPYDASRLASFVTMLTLPVPVLREFIGLIAWKRDSAKAAQHVQVADPSQLVQPKVELCLENRTGAGQSANAQEDTSSQGAGGSALPKSSINYDRSRNMVDFTLTVIFDQTHVPTINVAGGAGWLPQCVAVRLRFMFGEGSSSISLLDMEGSHGGWACWTRIEDWDRCKEKVAKAVQVSGVGNPSDQGQGRLRTVAEAIQLTLQSALQQLRRGSANTSSPIPGEL